MRNLRLALAFATFALAAAVPAFAQDAMASSDQMASHDQMAAARPMTAAEMRTMKACNAKSHDAMMKDRRCARIVAAHPDAMQHDAMMSSGH